jgi:hypothetical protein
MTKIPMSTMKGILIMVEKINWKWRRSSLTAGCDRKEQISNAIGYLYPYCQIDQRFRDEAKALKANALGDGSLVLA